MKALLNFCCVTALALTLVGCGHIDVARESDPNRVVTGSVAVRMNLMPPPDAELTVRVLEPSDTTAAPAAMGRDLVIGERGAQVRPERVVGEQVIQAPGALPVFYRVEFRADDAQLRRGLMLEARIAWGRKVRFRTVDAPVLTLENLGEPHTILLAPVP